MICVERTSMIIKSIILLVTTSVIHHTRSSTTNIRDFYFQISDIGPTHGETKDSPATKWLLEKTWRENVAVTVDPLKPNTKFQDMTHVKEAMNDMNLSVILTTFASSIRQSGRTGNLSEAVGVIPGTLIWEFLCEDDSAGTGFSQILLRMARNKSYTNGRSRLTSRQAYEAWRDYVREAYERTLPFREDEEKELHARVGFPSNTHSVAPFCDIILVERANDDVGSYATSIPFLRGAATQFNIKFGIDLSLWWGVIDGCVGSSDSMPGKLHERIMYASYISGASIIAMEGIPWMNSTTNEPFPIANVMDKFGLFFTKHLKPEQRGNPDVSVALVMPEDHGWSESPSWSNGDITTWNFANLAANRNVRFLHEIFRDVFYPGSGDLFSYFAFPFGHVSENESPPPSPFARSSITSQYAPSRDDVYITNSNLLDIGRFEKRDDVRTWFQKSGSNPSTYRPMADSTYGDILDVLVGGQNSDENLIPALSKYSVVIWNNESLSDASREFIFSNASDDNIIFILSAGCFGSNLDDIVTLSGDTRTIRSWSWSSVFVREPIVLAHTSSIDDGVEILVRSVPEGYPILLRKNNVYVSLEIWNHVSTLTSTLLSHVIHPVVRLIGDKVPPMYFTSSKSSDGHHRFVVLENNAGASCKNIHVSIDTADLIGSQCDCERFLDEGGRSSNKCSFESDDDALIVLVDEIEAYGTWLLDVRCG